MLKSLDIYYIKKEMSTIIDHLSIPIVVRIYLDFLGKTKRANENCFTQFIFIFNISQGVEDTVSNLEL